uniref:Vacuolar protein sorting-associated protein 45 n=1 Tax=Arcella intermedia TaxID=1963864 RepID=A0A6B2L164_9EUKA|eukprot:TRINITY_DN24828_c0_g1_i1.p1 TRINITY_DN24828_c0_g1~~TRINITY_DN24828_c0_g1_i1.p1  ORF type:complete len:572 (+),score=141.29 TRINITY_DN24828_c0_g1_i1:26-1717(+)
MDVIKALRDYISKMVKLKSGMKVLLLDEETAGIVSMVYPQSEILQEEVYLFERLDTTNREIMVHLHGFCFLRPTPENLQLLKMELSKPRYGEYYLFFTNTLSKEDLELLAKADQHEVVQEVQEFYGDYYAVNPDTWSLNLSPESSLTVNDPHWPSSRLRISQGLLACLLSLKIRPYIRAQRTSPLAMGIAQDILENLQKQEIRDLLKTRKGPEPILLILDRQSDPVTPLLTQWTYQAMVHELIGIKNDLVVLGKSNVLESSTIVLSPQQDAFYRENMYKNFGDLGIAIKGLVDDYQSKQKTNRDIKTIEDMKRFVSEYPEFRKLSGNVSKHVAIMETLQKQIGERKLLDVSELEQTLACHDGFTEAVKKMEELFGRPELNSNDLLRLLMLFSLRYETHSQYPPANIKFNALLKARGVDDEDIKLVSVLLKYGGYQRRNNEVPIFENKSLISILRKVVDKGLTGVTNVFTQHKPLLAKILDALVKGVLPENAFPFIDGALYKERPFQVIVFYVGGITFEEAALINELNSGFYGNNFTTNFLIGGTSIHNSKSFLDALRFYSKIQ